MGAVLRRGDVRDYTRRPKLPRSFTSASSIGCRVIGRRLPPSFPLRPVANMRLDSAQNDVFRPRIAHFATGIFRRVLQKRRERRVFALDFAHLRKNMRARCAKSKLIDECRPAQSQLPMLRRRGPVFVVDAGLVRFQSVSIESDIEVFVLAPVFSVRRVLHRIVEVVAM